MLRPAGVDVPAPGPDEVRVRVITAGVNPVDAKVRRGDLSHVMDPTFPQTLGNEFAGIVEAAGADVTGLEPGQDVLGFTALAAYAESVNVPVGHVTPKPDALPWRIAGAPSAAGRMAHHAIDTLEVGPGDKILVHAADPARIVTTVDDAAAERHGVQRLRGARSAAVLAELADLAAAGHLQLPIHLSVPLRDAARAHRVIDGGHLRGKVVLEVSPPTRRGGSESRRDS